MFSPDRHVVSDMSVGEMQCVESTPNNRVCVHVCVHICLCVHLSACVSKRMLCTDNGEPQAAEYLK